MVTAVEKLKPTIFERYEWAALANVQRFLGVNAVIILFLLVDCNNFFLKFCLWVPPEHDLLKFRVMLWGLCALATSKEWYEFVTNKYCHRMGPYTWISFYTCGVEMLTAYKASEGRFTAPFPWYVKVIWVCIFSGFLWLLSIAYANGQRELESQKGKREYNPYNPDLEVIEHSKKEK